MNKLELLHMKLRIISKMNEAKNADEKINVLIEEQNKFISELRLLAANGDELAASELEIMEYL